MIQELCNDVVIIARCIYCAHLELTLKLQLHDTCLCQRGSDSEGNLRMALTDHGLLQFICNGLQMTKRCILLCKATHGF